MFHKQKLKIQLVAAVIYNLLAAVFPPKEGEETDLRHYSYALAMAMIGAKNFRQFDQIYDQIDIRVLYLEGPRAFRKFVRELIREARKRRY